MQSYLCLFSYRVLPKKQLCKMSPVNSRKNGFTCSIRKPPNISTSHYGKKSMCNRVQKCEIKSVGIVLQCYQLYLIIINSIFFFSFKWYFFYFVLTKNSMKWQKLVTLILCTFLIKKKNRMPLGEKAFP